MGIIALFATLFFSCEDKTFREYEGNAPVYMTYEDMRKAIVTDYDSELKNPGKIYYKDDYIFIVEELKGIHVYDNLNPSSPVKKVFVTIPGVVDISITGYILYADSYVDLVILDVENIDNIHEVGRMKDVLPYTVPPTGNDLPMAWVDEKKGVVTGWEERTIRERIYTVPSYPWPIFFEGGGMRYLDMANASGASSGVSGSGTGFGGSMARFGIKGNVLYIVDRNNLSVIDITNKTNPREMGDFYPGWDVETMFLAGDRMYLGASTGMVIFDISNPLVPKSRVFFNHASSCDPVVVDDTIAYVTLRSGNTCAGTVNCLDVINVKNINSPSMVATFPMTNPHGLGKSGDLLFICDGDAGLKIYDASDPASVGNKQVSAYPDINAYDVIPIGSLLVMIGEDGLYQYSYSDIQNIRLLSSIAISSE